MQETIEPMTEDSLLPSVLYKYCPPERIDILVNNKISFSSPSRLNDLLEMKPKVFFDPQIDLKAHHKIKHDNPSIPLLTLPPVSQEDERASFWNALESSRVLCLSETPSNPLMWSYYACGHQGFVLGFDASSPELFKKGELLQVNYSAIRPCIVYGENEPRTVFATKADYWAHEKEWRSVLVDQDADPIWLVPFPPIAIKQVVIGQRASITLRKFIKCCLDEHRYHHVDVYEAQPRADDWKIELTKVTL